MLKITIPDVKGWDPNAGDDGEFVEIKGATLVLEHSLVSLQKWESKWHKPYLGKQEKTTEEVIDYIRCMTMSKASGGEVDPRVYNYIPQEAIEKIAAYINDPMTATTFSNNGNGKGGSKEVVTAEIIYYWMIKMGVPIEFRKWHLNQLMTLLKVCELKETPQKKMGRNELNARNKSLNAQRKAKLHTHG